MKKIAILTLASALVFGFSSCKDDEEVPVEIGESNVPELYLDATNNPPHLEEVLNVTHGIAKPRDLEFHPDNGALWIMNKGTGGSDFVIVTGPGTGGQSIIKKRDSHSGHFVVNGSGMAFSNIGTFATSPEIKNTTSNPNSTFMGPALWSSDLDVFANIYQSNWTPGQPLGSHYDMLHQSPFCMGIAHEVNNVFWVFDGYNENLCRYDFVDDHGPGAEYHADGMVTRHSDVKLVRVADIPSHMVMDKSSGKIYICDTDQGRVIEVDPATSSFKRKLTATNEALAKYEEYTGSAIRVMIEGLKKPSGIAVRDGRLFVSDYESGILHVIGIESADELTEFDTGMKGNTGIEISNDGEIWVANYLTNSVSRIVRN